MRWAGMTLPEAQVRDTSTRQEVSSRCWKEDSVLREWLFHFKWNCWVSMVVGSLVFFSSVD